MCGPNLSFLANCVYTWYPPNSKCPSASHYNSRFSYNNDSFFYRSISSYFSPYQFVCYKYHLSEKYLEYFVPYALRVVLYALEGILHGLEIRVVLHALKYTLPVLEVVLCLEFDDLILTYRSFVYHVLICFQFFLSFFTHSTFLCM